MVYSFPANKELCERESETPQPRNCTKDDIANVLLRRRHHARSSCAPARRPAPAVMMFPPLYDVQNRHEIVEISRKDDRQQIARHGAEETEN